MRSLSKLRRAQNAWRRENPDKVSRSNRKSYQRYIEDRRQRCAAYRARNPAYFSAKTAEFRAKHPNYQRERYAARKLRLAWRSWSRTCAANRREG